ncbi:MAG: type III pantothenate kinase [Spirochaetes bacterium]|nr:type III pantothenate kinase [Spirochaetota bacterium]
MKNNEYILGFNIGNTNTKMGIYCMDDILPEKIFIYKTDIQNDAGDLVKTVKDYIQQYEIETGEGTFEIVGAVISSVVTEVDEQYRIMAGKKLNLALIEVNSKANLNIVLNYEKPEELGADRIANAVAAYSEYKADSIIIDLGTANTFSVVDKNGNFIGGLIGPGMGISIDALYNLTSKLPKVNFEKPDCLIATNPVEAVKSGYFYGTMNMLYGIVSEIEKLYQREFLIILTGGFSNTVGNYYNKKHILDTLLTMKGLKYIYNMNKNV